MIGLFLRKAGWLVGAGLQNLGLSGFGLMPIVAAFLLAVVPAGATWVKLKIDHAEDIGDVRGKAKAACAARIANITARLNEAAQAREAQADRAAAETPDLTTNSEIEAACAREVSCRDGGDRK